MKLPRDVSGHELAKLLRAFQYAITRQAGSHIRLTTQLNGEHHITIPNHSSLRMGTLAHILGDVAFHFKLTRDELYQRLFG